MTARAFHDLTSLGPDGPPLSTLRVPPMPPGRRDRVARTPSRRDFADAAPDVDDAVLRATAVALARDGDGRKAYPSAGGLYAVLGLLVRSYAGTVVPLGTAHQPVWGAVDADECNAASYRQVTGAPNWLVLTGRLTAYQERYGQRGYRYMLLETGHLAQSVLTEVARAGLDAVPIGAFDDGALTELLGLARGDEIPLYLIAVGRGATATGKDL